MNVIKGERVPIKCWTSHVEIEEEARQQLLNIATLPFIYRHLAVMPDVHYGKGSTVGTVLPTVRAIIPAAVGVDIGCGMQAVKTDLVASDLPDSLKELFHNIEGSIPVGFGKWNDIPEDVSNCWVNLFKDEFEVILDKYPSLKKANTFNQLGTLGGGNHFIEICLDENQVVWFMLHSGSRGIGNRIGNVFIDLAKEEMKRYFVNLPDEDLSYLPEGSVYFKDYMQALMWSQKFAKANRDLMMKKLVSVVESALGRSIKKDEMAINCHHNYVSIENHFNHNVYITRKGAVSAKKGELGIIPGSMGTKSFIVRGLGNADSFRSCSHGAGRVMSRNEAKKIVSTEEHVRALEGVECRKDDRTLDETPSAYKNIDDVMKSQEDLVEIVATLKQILCVKG